MRFGKRLRRRAARRGLAVTARHRLETPGVPFTDADDQAHYACVCGHGFKASVTTSVCCPRCGTVQPW